MVAQRNKETERTGIVKCGRLRVLNRDAIKYIAVFAMALNHIGSVFLERGTFWGELLIDTGYFTAPVMCYFLVEGYQYTHSRKKYLQRLLLSALVSQIPFYMALAPEGAGILTKLNMMCTLSVCFLILEVKTWIQEEGIRLLLYALLFLVNGKCDWATMAPVYTLLFAYAYGSQKKMTRAFVIAMAVFMLDIYRINSFLFPVDKALLLTGFSVLGVMASAVAVLYLYNGKRAERGSAVSKWFFYIFYPGHLLVIGIIRMFCI